MTHPTGHPHVLIRSAWLALLAAVGLAPAGAAEPPKATGANVTIYRCVDSRGQLVALRDSPCRTGERQEVLQMQRPQDPPPRTATTQANTTPAAAPAPAREIRVVNVQPPQPMYECTGGDGERYFSDSDEGNPRWVPYWTMGYQVVAMPPRPPRPPVRPPPVRPPGDPGPTPGPGPGFPPPRHHGPTLVVPGGTWVRDSCIRLPQEQACARLSDRRYEILRIYHAGMPSGRQALDREQAQLDARLANDCPGY